MSPEMSVPRPAVRALLLASAAVAVVIGLGMVLIAVTVGDCSAFGGHCPAEPTPLLQDDTFGTAAFGGFLASAVPTFASRPSRRRAVVALAVGAVTALVVGLIARAAAGS